MNNRLAVSLLCLENINKLDLFLKILKKNNIKLIELPISKITKNYSFNENELRLFKKKIEKYSIKVSSIQSIFFKKDELNIFNQSDHKKILLHLKKVFKVAKYFKARNIIFGSPKNRLINKKLKNKYTDKKVINIFSKIAKLASFYGLNFCLEPNSKFYKCNFVNNLGEAIKIIKKVKKKNFLINADTGNIFLEKDKCNIKKNLKFIENVQISEKNLISISKGKINHKKILKN